METPPLKPSRSKRIFRRALFALAAFVTLVALIIAEEDWRGAHAKGELSDAARLIPPKVPDDQNFAMTPYFAPYFKPETLQQPVKDDRKWVDGHPVVESTGPVERGRSE